MKAPLLLLLAAMAMLFGVVRGETVSFRGTTIHTFVAKPAEIELYWLDAKGKPMRELRKVQALVQEQGGDLRMLMNAGIFEPDGIPSGLCVIDGRVLHPLNTANGKGNFFLKPTGVFFIDKERAGILETDEYGASHLRPRLAIQSGPLLLRKGKVHPAFRPESTSRLHRNGAGILPDGSVLFAITEFTQDRLINLFDFAMFFKTRGCRDALFLDGDLSQMEVAPMATLGPGNHLGAIFAIVKRSAVPSQPPPHMLP